MNRETQIEKVLCTHPGVREAAVVRDDSNAILAFVVANDAYLSDVLGRGATESNVLGKWRKAYDLSQLTKEAASAPAGFNTIGWNSSYTRKPIPDREIREWVEMTVADILRLAPKAAYEIGCGTGLLLTRIAPKCNRYVAVDFAPAVLARLREQLLTMPALKERVQIEERRADDFTGLDENSFDTVLLSSVVQYFPSLAYLTKVLGSAVNLVKPGGHVYVGDIRSLPLLPVFATSVELFQAADEMSAGQLRERVRRRIGREQELVLSPAYFLMLQHRISKISAVEIRPLHGNAHNEMSGYRYQAILHIGLHREVPTAIDFGDWPARKWSLGDIRSMLLAHPNEILGIKRIRNARIEKDLEAMACLGAADASCTVGELRRDLVRYKEEGIDPQDLFDLEADGLGFKVFLSWLAGRHDGSYDALFVPGRSSEEKGSLAAVSWPRPEALEFACLSNRPGQDKHRSDLITLLRAYCSQNLREKMVPQDFALVDTLPYAPDGDVDARALLAARRASLVF